jgi:hypothetical protein
VVEIEVLNTVFKRFFEDVNAEDENEIRVQKRTSFWFM